MTLRRLAIAGIIALGVAGTAAATAWSAVRQALRPVARTAPDTIFAVPRGAALGAIARDLEDVGLVRSARVFAWLARYRGQDQELRAGEYRLSAALAPEEILGRIARGEVATWEVVVPEGLTAAQIAARLAAAGVAEAGEFAAVVNDPAVARELGVEGDTLEGYLFPETYRLPRGLPPREVARALVEQFLGVWRRLEPRARERELSMKQVVTLASIVEKETGVPDERPLIAAVFLNRLARGMRLETDPTVIYGIEEFDGNLRRSDLENGDNPYNTYKIAGLPPGPIASPGAAALRAVLEPANSDYLYFVSKNDGSHTFSRSYREHVSAVNRYQKGGR